MGKNFWLKRCNYTNLNPEPSFYSLFVSLRFIPLYTYNFHKDQLDIGVENVNCNSSRKSYSIKHIKQLNASYKVTKTFDFNTIDCSLVHDLIHSRWYPGMC